MNRPALEALRDHMRRRDWNAADVGPMELYAVLDALLAPDVAPKHRCSFCDRVTQPGEILRVEGPMTRHPLVVRCATCCAAVSSTSSTNWITWPDSRLAPRPMVDGTHVAPDLPQMVWPNVVAQDTPCGRGEIVIRPWGPPDDAWPSYDRRMAYLAAEHNWSA